MEHHLHLPGPVVSLAPLGPEHAEELAEIGDAEAYAWHTSPPPLTAELAMASILRLRADPTLMPLAVIDTVARCLRGITSFYEHVSSVPRVEIGHTYYGRKYWGGVPTRTRSC